MMLEAPVWFFPDFVVTDRRHSLVWGGGGGEGGWEFPRKYCFLISGGRGYSSIARFCFFSFFGWVCFVWEKLTEFFFCLTVFVCVFFVSLRIQFEDDLSGKAQDLEVLGIWRLEEQELALEERQLWRRRRGFLFNWRRGELKKLWLCWDNLTMYALCSGESFSWVVWGVFPSPHSLLLARSKVPWHHQHQHYHPIAWLRLLLRPPQRVPQENGRWLELSAAAAKTTTTHLGFWGHNWEIPKNMEQEEEEENRRRSFLLLWGLLHHLRYHHQHHHQQINPREETILK